MLKLKKGFTLIELLVVIAIIAILATVVIINVLAARAKANDSKILTEITNANRGAIACMTNNDVPLAPVSSTAIAGQVKVISADISVCADSAGNPAIASGLNASWPWLETNDTTDSVPYNNWRYGLGGAVPGANLAVDNSTWSWSALGVGTGNTDKIITFSNLNTTKAGF